MTVRRIRLRSKPDVLRVADAAKLLFIHRNTLVRMCNDGIIAHLRHAGGRGERLIPRTEIERVLKEMNKFKRCSCLHTIAPLWKFCPYCGKVVDARRKSAKTCGSPKESPSPGLPLRTTVIDVKTGEEHEPRDYPTLGASERRM